MMIKKKKIKKKTQNDDLSPDFALMFAFFHKLLNIFIF